MNLQDYFQLFWVLFKVQNVLKNTLTLMHMSNQQMATTLLAINTTDNKCNTNEQKVIYGFQHK